MNLTSDKSPVLVLAPHTDDGEFGCGGTIHKLNQAGREVYYAAFSACKQSVQPEFEEDVLIKEVKQATRILGIPSNRLILFDYEVRTFNYHRQEILENLIALREKIQPSLVLMPSLNDIHQDHKTIAEEGLRAFKFCSILCYEMPWNNLNFVTSGFIKLSEEDIQKKIQALGIYKSQSHRQYANADFIRSLAITRGVQIHTKYAETFEVLRSVG
ncbi:MAG: PIG-L family deacetylase [Bacteroidia bacterium]|nr:PIG-L family deacetylase [Bacteroidia bacterium]